MGVLSTIFHNAETYHKSIERVLSSIAEQPVSIGRITTAWVGRNPIFSLENVQINNQNTAEQYANISSIAGELNIFSVLRFWPTFNEFVVESPKLVFESLQDGSFRFIGKPYQPSKKQQRRSLLMASWLFSQKKGDIHNGEFVWKHREGSVTEIKQFSVQYRHKNDQRVVYAVAKHNQEAIGLSSSIQGNLFFSDAWNADVAILSGSDITHLDKNNFQVTVRDGQGSIHSDHLHVQRLTEVANIVGRGSSLEKWLSESQFTGSLNNIQLDFSGALINIKKWQFSAKGKELSWLPTEKFSGLTNVNAIFRLNESNGALVFSILDTQFDWPQYFSKPLDVNEFSAQAALIHDGDEWQVDVSDIVLSSPDAQFSGGTAQINKVISKPAYVAFNSAIKVNNLVDMANFFPNKTSAKFLKWWDGAIQSDTIIEGDISFIGDLTADALKSGEANLLANLKAKNIVMDYGFQESWPKISAHEVDMKLSGESLFFISDNAKLGQMEMVGANAVISDLFSPERSLEINSGIQGALGPVVDFFQDGPLTKKKLSNKALKIEKVTGNVTGSLQVSMPLKSIKDSKITGQASIAQGAFSLGSLLDINDINGNVSYTESSLNAENVSGTILDGAALANVKTIQQGKPPNIRVSVEGKGNMSHLDSLVSPQLASRLSGFSDWQAIIDFSKQGVDVQVNSDLKGVKVDLPKPLFKEPATVTSLSFTSSSGANRKNSLSVSMGNVFELALQEGSTGNLLDQGVVKLGELAIKQQTIFPQEGIHIYSKGDANIDKWISAISDMSKIPAKQSTKRSFIKQLRLLEVSSDNVVLFDKNLGETVIKATSPDSETWNANISGVNVSGLGVLQPFVAPQQYSFDLEHLDWPHTLGVKDKTKRSLNSDHDNSVLPNSYPHILLKAKHFRMRNQNFGSLLFEAKPSNNSWLFEKLELESPRLKITGTGGWTLDENKKNVSDLGLTFQSKEGGQALEDFGFENILKDGKVNILMELSWQGAPASFSLATLSGSYSLDVRKGSFPKVQAAQSRIFGLLNVNALSRRLRLDFGDIFGQGLLFDKMESTGKFENGAVVLDKFYIFSPAVYVEALGQVKLVDEAYDMQVLISPQLGGNVALLAALSNPAAGAVVWLVDKAFKGKLNKAIVYTYNVDGPWDKPKVVREVAETSPTVDLN